MSKGEAKGGMEQNGLASLLAHLANCLFDVGEETENVAISVDFDRLCRLAFAPCGTILYLGRTSWWCGLGYVSTGGGRVEYNGCGNMFE